MAEVKAYMSGLRRRGWEQARMIAYCCLKPWAKDLTPEDVIRLPWEEETENEPEEENKLDALRAMIPKIKEKIYGK